MSDELQSKYDRLLEKVRQMRGWQKEWFKYHISTDREKARRFEREVDQLIDEEVRKKKSNQREIF